MLPHINKLDRVHIFRIFKSCFMTDLQNETPHRFRSSALDGTVVALRLCKLGPLLCLWQVLSHEFSYSGPI